MKKFIFILCFICMISGCSQATSTHVIEKDFSKEAIIEKNYDEIQQMIKDKESFILYIGRPDCQDCEEFEPYLDDYLQQHPGVYLYYFNTKQYRDQSKEDDASQADKDFYEKLYEEFEFSWTPTLKFVYEGKFEDTYTYLDSEYYQISDSDEKKKKKQEYIEQLTKWLDEKFVEENGNEEMSKLSSQYSK